MTSARPATTTPPRSRTHRDIIKDIIRDMAIEAGVSIVAGAIVGFFTWGGGAAAGGAIAGWRIASAARKILAALRALKAAAKLRAVAKLTSVVSKVKPLRAVLAKFKNAKKIDNAADAAGPAKALTGPSRTPWPTQHVQTSLTTSSSRSTSSTVCWQSTAAGRKSWSRWYEVWETCPTESSKSSE